MYLLLAMVKKLKYQLTLPITEKPKYIGFALDVLLKPSMLSSAFLPVGMNNLLTLNKRLFFLISNASMGFVFIIKKTKKTQLQLTQNEHFSSSSRIVQIKDTNSTHL